MSSPAKSMLFAAVLCLVCSLLLTGASTVLGPRQQRNIALDKQKNILKSVGLLDAVQARSPATVTALYDRHIRDIRVGAEGELMPPDQAGSKDLHMYLHMDGEEIVSYILPIDTRGLWGRILGYIAIQSDGETIAGFTVYQHSETPGLGGEIEQRWFQKNFVGKKLVDQGGAFVALGVAKGAVETAVPAAQRIHYVDGISGATLTGQYLEGGLRNILERYEPVSIRFRRNLIQSQADLQGINP